MKNLNLRNSQAIALLIGSITLVIVLFLALTTIKNTQINQRIAANFQSKLQGEASTQALIKEARQFLVTQKPGQSSFSLQCLNGLCLNVKDPAIWNNTTAWVAAKLPQSALKTKAKILGNPRYIIEYIGDKTSQDSLSVGGEYGTNKDVSTKPIYRITGKSQGETGAKESVIQTTVY